MMDQQDRIKRQAENRKWLGEWASTATEEEIQAKAVEMADDPKTQRHWSGDKFPSPEARRETEIAFCLAIIRNCAAMYPAPPPPQGVPGCMSYRDPDPTCKCDPPCTFNGF